MRDVRFAHHAKLAFLVATAEVSETGDQILRNNPDINVVALFNGQGCSLRSRKGTVPVNKVCEAFGGGGHKEAAGFKNCDLLTTSMQPVVDSICTAILDLA